MASTTPNIGLTLPTGAEKVSRQIINANNTIIDSKIGAVPGGQNLQGEIDALNGKTSIFLQSTDNTWEKIWTKISKLDSGESATIYINNTPWSIITGGTRTSGAPAGTIAKVSSNQYKFVLNVGSANDVICASINNVSSSSAGTYTENDINSNINNLFTHKELGNQTSKTSVAITIPASTTGELIIASDSSTRLYKGMYRTLSGGALSLVDIVKGNNISYSVSGSVVTFTMNASALIKVFNMRLVGSQTDPTCVFS